MISPAHISVVDDDESIRESLPDLLKEHGFSVQAFASAEAFLAGPSLTTTQCLILDINLPGMNGLRTEARTLATKSPRACHLHQRKSGRHHSFPSTR